MGIIVDFEIKVVLEAFMGETGTFSDALTSLSDSLADATALSDDGTTAFDTALVVEATSMGNSRLFAAVKTEPPAPLVVRAVTSFPPTGHPTSEPSAMPTNVPTTNFTKKQLDPLLELLMPISVLTFISLLGFAYWLYTRRTRVRKYLVSRVDGNDVEAKLTDREKRRNTKKRGWSIFRSTSDDESLHVNSASITEDVEDDSGCNQM
jgi:hypothetical protein